MKFAAFGYCSDWTFLEALPSDLKMIFIRSKLSIDNELRPEKVLENGPLCRLSHRICQKTCQLLLPDPGPSISCLRVKTRKWSGAELNRRHMDFQSIALPTELPDQQASRLN